MDCEDWGRELLGFTNNEVITLEDSQAIIDDDCKRIKKYTDKL